MSSIWELSPLPCQVGSVILWKSIRLVMLLESKSEAKIGEYRKATLTVCFVVVD